MALITCPECSKQISEFAFSCPHCGLPLNPEIISLSKQKKEQKLEEEDHLEKQKHEEYEYFFGVGSYETKDLSSGTKGKKKETKCTCRHCGKIWYYDKTDAIFSRADSLSNFGKDMMIVTGWLFSLFIPDKKVTDLNKCPNCSSKSIFKEEVFT